VLKQSARCRTCNQHRLTGRRFPPKKRKRFDCSICSEQISRSGFNGRGHCRRCHFLLLRQFPKPKRLADLSSSGRACYFDRAGEVVYAGDRITVKSANDWEDDLTFSVGAAWGSLRRSWKGYHIARKEEDFSAQVKYQKQIQNLVQALNRPSPEFEDPNSAYLGWPEDNESNNYYYHNNEYDSTDPESGHASVQIPGNYWAERNGKIHHFPKQEIGNPNTLTRPANGPSDRGQVDDSWSAPLYRNYPKERVCRLETSESLKAYGLELLKRNRS
jgi:hypothetical protein